MYMTRGPDLVWRIREGFLEGVTFGQMHETEKHPWDDKRI